MSIADPFSNTFFNLVQIRSGLPEERLYEHLAKEVATAATQIPGACEYIQNVISKQVDMQLRPPVDWRTDVALSFALEDGRDADDLAASPEYRAFLGALAPIATGVALLQSKRYTLTPPPALVRGRDGRSTADGIKLQKRLVILRRAHHLDLASYRDEWWTVHAAMVREIPAVQGYFGGHVDARCIPVPPDAGASVDIDNIVELWFTDEQTMRQSLPPDGHIQAHARSIHSNMSIALVNERCFA